jgi:nucleoside-diphosphate kinase
VRWGAIDRNRELMGPTDSTQAAPGTIRGDFGTDIERNAVHGSDAPETARVEIAYFFNATEILAAVEALPA